MDFHQTVLVAEDFATMRKIICHYLKQIGFKRVLEAEDGLSALELLEHDEVGLVVTDWNMPNMGGLELVRRIRSNPATAALPVLMVSIEDLKDYIIAAVRAGVNHYIAKPFTLEDLREKIEMIFAKSKLPDSYSRPQP
jgi:two-component system chemotaxis response regulator CheY